MKGMRVRWDSGPAKEKAKSESRQALAESAEFVLAHANDSVPLEEGTLARSGATSVEGDTAVISYDTPYAIRLHENPQYRFRHGRRGKWLELTFQEVAGALERRWAGRIHIG